MLGFVASAHDLGCRQACGREVHLVLHLREKAPRLAIALSIVGSEGKNFANALVGPRLARADVADARKQLIEIVGDPVGALEPLVIHREALDQVFAEPGRGPLTELRAPMRFDAVADGENGSEGVVLDFPRHLSGPLRSNYPEFSDGCGAPERLFLVNVAEVFADGPDIFLKQLRHLCLREPERLPLEAALDARSAIFGLVEDQL